MELELTREDIINKKAGEELDLLIAKKFMKGVVKAYLTFDL